MLDISKCSGCPESCPVAATAAAELRFYESVTEIDSFAEASARQMAEFLGECSLGTCHGRYLESTKSILAALISRPET